MSTGQTDEIFLVFRPIRKIRSASRNTAHVKILSHRRRPVSMGEMGPGLRWEGEDGRIVQNHERIWALARIGSPENSRICRILIIQRSDWEMPVFPLRLMLVTAIACAIAAPSRAAESQTTPGVSDTQAVRRRALGPARRHHQRIRNSQLQPAITADSNCCVKRKTRLSAAEISYPGSFKANYQPASPRCGRNTPIHCRTQPWS